jgi:hypothetical protein
VAELEAALERKAEATTEALKDGSVAECQRRVTCRRVRMVPAAAPDDRERAALRRGQLNSGRVEARQNRLIVCGRTARLGSGKSPKHYSDRQRGPPGPVPP